MALILASVVTMVYLADRPASASKGALSVKPASGMSIIQPKVATPFDPINHIIVIYQENWSFDALYGNFPGANGLANAATQIAAHPQIDVFSTPYGQPFGGTNRTVPQLINGSTPDGNFANFPGTAVPYPLTNFITPDKVTGDIVHRFYTEQSQIDGGKMDKFVSLIDNPGLVLSGFDATNMPEGLLAQKYVLCDNFFHAAFGGSFLNHHWLIAAQSPVHPAAPSNLVQPAGTNSLNGNQGFNANGDPFNVSKLSLGQSSVNGNSVDSTVTRKASRSTRFSP